MPAGGDAEVALRCRRGTTRETVRMGLSRRATVACIRAKPYQRRRESRLRRLAAACELDAAGRR